ncbi:MAG: class I SAM-dependent methyltransferase [Methylocystis sp.]
MAWNLFKTLGKNEPSLSNDNSHLSPYAQERYVRDPSSCYFYHTMDLPEFGLQDGGWDLRGRFDDYVGGVDFSNKRVLDVGAASGFLSFEAERSGASEVVSFDLDSADRQSLLPFAGSSYVTDREAWVRMQTDSFLTWQNSYWLAHRLLGSKAKAVYGDVYRLPPSIGEFDVIILGAILEHLIDPLSAMYSISKHAKDIIVINTDYFDVPDMLARFNGRHDRPDNSFVFWVYSIPLYDEYMRIMGFERLAARKNKFLGMRSPTGERPELDRVALVYQKRT